VRATGNALDVAAQIFTLREPFPPIQETPILQNEIIIRGKRFVGGRDESQRSPHPDSRFVGLADRPRKVHFPKAQLIRYFIRYVHSLPSIRANYLFI